MSAWMKGTTMDTTAHTDRQDADHVTQASKKAPPGRFMRGAGLLTHWVDEQGSVVRLISTLPASPGMDDTHSSGSARNGSNRSS